MRVERSTFILVKKIKSHKRDYRVSNFNAKFKVEDIFKKEYLVHRIECSQPIKLLIVSIKIL